MIVVTFKDQVPVELVAEMLTSSFAGLCKAVQAGAGPRIVVLRPTKEEYPAVKAQLEEFVREGGLTFVEQPG
jgi:hypothetical protein